MSEEIVTIPLSELVKIIRFRRKNGTVLEAEGLEAARDCCAELRGHSLDEHSAECLCALINAAAQVSRESFPVQVEFAIRSRYNASALSGN